MSFLSPTKHPIRADVYMPLAKVPQGTGWGAAVLQYPWRQRCAPAMQRPQVHHAGGKLRSTAGCAKFVAFSRPNSSFSANSWAPRAAEVVLGRLLSSPANLACVSLGAAAAEPFGLQPTPS